LRAAPPCQPVPTPTATPTAQVKVYRLVTVGTVEQKIVERACLKLKLDAVVVKLDRLAGGDRSKALTKEEMQSMITFGADNVIRAAADNPNAIVTDADIEEILRVGDKRTRDMVQAVDAKLSSLGGAFASFAGGGAGDGTASGGLLDFTIEDPSMQTFEGVDYKGYGRAARREEEERARALREAIFQAQAEEMAATTSRPSNRLQLSHQAEMVMSALAASEGEPTAQPATRPPPPSFPLPHLQAERPPRPRRRPANTARCCRPATARLPAWTPGCSWTRSASAPSPPWRWSTS
jgi:hypothetical protein